MRGARRKRGPPLWGEGEREAQWIAERPGGGPLGMSDNPDVTYDTL